MTNLVYYDKVQDIPKDFILIQVDRDVLDILEYIGYKDQESFNPSYLFVKLDKSGSDYVQVYGTNSCNLDAYVTKLMDICVNCGLSVLIGENKHYTLYGKYCHNSCSKSRRSRN